MKLKSQNLKRFVNSYFKPLAVSEIALTLLILLLSPVQTSLRSKTHWWLKDRLVSSNKQNIQSLKVTFKIY